MSRRCAVCGEAEGGSVVYCRACDMGHHQDCWDYLGSCSRFGCGCQESKAAPSQLAAGPLIIDTATPDPPVRGGARTITPSPQVVLGTLRLPMEVTRLATVFTQLAVPYRVEYVDRVHFGGECARVHVPYLHYREARRIAIDHRIQIDFRALHPRVSLINYPVGLAATLFWALMLPKLMPLWISCVLFSVCGRDLMQLVAALFERKSR